MKIMVETASYHLQNFGDVCMLQAGVQRLQHHFPDAEIGVLTLDPSLLDSLVPNVTPLPARGRALLCGDGALLPGLGRLFDNAGEIEHSLRRKVPKIGRLLTKFINRTYRNKDIWEQDVLYDFLKNADAVVCTGGGFVTDSFVGQGKQTLRLLELAMETGGITAMFGQGIGPINDPSLSCTARRVLPLLDMLTLREPNTGPQILNEYGGNQETVAITGDDAIEIVFDLHPTELGNGLGVNMRAAAYSGMGSSEIEAVRVAVNNVVEQMGCPLLPIPISFHKNDSDARTLIDMFGDDIGSLSLHKHPREVILQAGKCRVVITGSYHGAIFALSQGIPVVALVRSAYYDSKFSGVAEQFGCGCIIVSAGEGFSKRIEKAVLTSWETADEIHDRLLLSAEKQINDGRKAYSKFAHMLEKRL